MNKNLLFIAWIGFSRRSQIIADSFGFELVNIHYLKHKYYLAPVRYLLQGLKTLQTLFKKKPKLVFVQNPPILAAILVYFYTRITGAAFIIDSHTGALLAPWWQWSIPIHRFLSKRAVLTIVTNRHLADLVQSWGARAFILEDVPTEFPTGNKPQLNGQFNLAVINTYAPDEPIEEVLNAAARLPATRFHITGDTVRAKKSYLMKQYDNVAFTGFLSDEDYIGLLREVDAVMVLTLDNYTMQRGACEAMALEKPIITSDWPVLRAYFEQGTVFIENTSDGICRGVDEMRAHHQRYRNEIRSLKQIRRRQWRLKRDQLTATLAEYTQ